MTKNDIPASALPPSRYGIASFAISLAVTGIDLVAILLLVFLLLPDLRRVFSTPIGSPVPLAPMLIGGAILCGGLLGLCIGVPLGIAGPFGRETNRRPAVLGLVNNALAVAATGVVLAVLGPALIQY